MDEPTDSAAPHPDPEIEALLHFQPVHRRTRRHDGWPAEVQRGFIVALAGCGNASKAAHAVGRTMSGAYKVRTAGGGESFAEAWDKAVDLYLERNPREPLTGRWRPSDGKAMPFGQRQPAQIAPAVEDGAEDRMLDALFEKYLLKLDQERQARLSGRIIEADFYVRQLSWFEVVLDLGERGVEVMMALKRGGTHVGDIVATPMSVLLDDLRRLYWAEEGGPERPPMPPLGRAESDFSTGEPLECQNAALTAAEQAEQERWLALRAEAQRAWEDKARSDAAEWRRRPGSARQPTG